MPAHHLLCSHHHLPPIVPLPPLLFCAHASVPLPHTPFLLCPWPSAFCLSPSLVYLYHPSTTFHPFPLSSVEFPPSYVELLHHFTSIHTLSKFRRLVTTQAAQHLAQFLKTAPKEKRRAKKNRQQNVLKLGAHKKKAHTKKNSAAHFQKRRQMKVWRNFSTSAGFSQKVSRTSKNLAQASTKIPHSAISDVFWVGLDLVQFKVK